MASIQFIAVPVGTAGGPEWRGVIARHGDQGYKIFWCASVLAELAAKADQGGLLAFASGQPKTALELCAEIGVEAVWAAETLFPALGRLGEGHWREDDGAWVCTSSMISRTLEWRGEVAASKALPAAKFSGGKLQFSRKLSDSEYKAWQRSCKLPEGVHLTKPCPKRSKGRGKCPVSSGQLSICPNICPDLSVLCPDSENGHKRTNEAEDTDIVLNTECPFSSQHNTTKDEVKKQQQEEEKPDNPVVVSDQSFEKQEEAEELLAELPPSDQNGTWLNLILRCLGRGATKEDLLRKISRAKSKNSISPGKYLRKDIESYLVGTDWDAADKEAARQQAETASRAEAEAEIWRSNQSAKDFEFWAIAAKQKGYKMPPLLAAHRAYLTEAV